MVISVLGHFGPKDRTDLATSVLRKPNLSQCDQIQPCAGIQQTLDTLCACLVLHPVPVEFCLNVHCTLTLMFVHFLVAEQLDVDGNHVCRGSLWSKISGRSGYPPPTVCARTDRPVNALQLCRWKFSHKKNFVADFLRKSQLLYKNWPFLHFCPLSTLRGSVRCSS